MADGEATKRKTSKRVGVVGALVRYVVGSASCFLNRPDVLCLTL